MIFVVSNVEKTEFVAGTIFTFGVNSISPWAVACALMLFPRMMDSWGAMRMGAGTPVGKDQPFRGAKKKPAAMFIELALNITWVNSVFRE